MSRMRFRLFGNFQVRIAGELSPDFITGKTVELFCYVLLHRQAPIVREHLAALLWDDLQSRRHLRQTLCTLRKKLHAEPEFPELLVIENDFVRLNPQADFWLDIAAFEEAFKSVEGISGKALTAQQAQMLQLATDLYRGDLLKGWYQDWCLYERERLQDMYVAMLLKLMSWCETQKQYEQGMHYGDMVLRYDHAHERTHRALMLLRYLDGDRTGALRQYERCVAALASDLRVAPSNRTNALCEKIRADRVGSPPPTQLQSPATVTIAHLHELQNEFSQLLSGMTQIEQELRRDINLLEAQQKTVNPPEQGENKQKN